MKRVKVTLDGFAPLIMHSCQCVNPLHPISKALKAVTSKRNKTDEDLEKISDLEWQAGLYWKDGEGLILPAEVIEATIRNGAKANKQGKEIEKFVRLVEGEVKVDIRKKYTLESLMKDPNHRDVRPMTVNRAKVMRTRPRFNVWGLSFLLQYDETKINIETIANALEFAGQYVGLCDSRPKYGKFTVRIDEATI